MLDTTGRVKEFKCKVGRKVFFDKISMKISRISMAVAGNVSKIVEYMSWRRMFLLGSDHKRSCESNFRYYLESKKNHKYILIDKGINKEWNSREKC